jgi:hypothetical protein
MELKRPTLYDIACHFWVSRIPGATIPATRLSNILERMFHKQQLTAMSLNYLKQQNLTDLYQLATGQISYEAFIAVLDEVSVAGEHTAKAEHHGKETQRLAQQHEWAVERQRKGEAADAARIARTIREAAHVARYDREREAAEAIRSVREVKWAAQCKHNCETAEVMYEARMSKPDFIAPTPYEIASHYRVNHLPGAVTSPLSNILKALYQGRSLSAAYLNYLKIKGLPRLHDLAIGQVTYNHYISDINAAKAAKIAAESARLEQAQAQRLLSEAIEGARISRESDPAYILRKKYGISDFDQSLLQRMMEILQSIDAGKRLTDVDFVWLNTEAPQFFTAELRKTHHLREAEFYANEYHRTQDAWKAINASGHYRRCNQPESALELLRSVPAIRFKTPKTHSAICTTHGGVLRDLGRRSEALHLGKHGHDLQPQNFRPCTLLGAVYMELGRFGEGHYWYAKAEELGASRQSIDTELRGIFLRMDEAKREIMRESLLAKDPNRYCWVNDKKTEPPKTTRSRR